MFACGSLVTTNGEALRPIEELHPELPAESAIMVVIVSVTIILISAADSIGVFKQTYKIIWTVLLA